MYSLNVERNKTIYKYWERKLTVDQISMMTGIPRSTVGYYVRKFNRMATQGKPIVFPESHKAEEKPADLIVQLTAKMFKSRVKDLIEAGEFEWLYYGLMDIKLVRELGIFSTNEEELAERLFESL